MKVIDNFDSVEERIEKFNSWKDNLPNYHYKGKELNPNDNICIVKETLPTADNGFMTKAGEGQNYKQYMLTHNLVTAVGDEYYAKKITLKKSDGTAYGDTDFASDGIFFHHDGSTSVSSSTVYGCMVLGNANTTPHENNTYGVVGSGASGNTFESGAYDSGGLNTIKTLTANYPRHNDGDGDNSGGANDQVTWAYSWTTGDFDTTGQTDLNGGVIVDRATNATPANAAKLLCHFEFSSAFEKTGNDTLKVFVNHTFEGGA
jgi:hypothetical protein